MPDVNYTYKARIIKVVDGDTVHAEVDCGFDIWARKTLRLYGINAPEISTTEGLSAKEFVFQYLGPGVEVIVETTKDRREKYGRYLATIWVGDINLNELMVSAGHAVPYML